MTKEILLSIRGLQTAENNEQDTVEMISPGEYYFKNGKHYFLYEEVLEGQKETCKNIIKAADDYMEVTKRGAVNVHMIFEKNKKNVTYYTTPFGSLLMGIDTHSVNVRETEDEISLEVLYALEINNEYLADCRISLKAAPRRERTKGSDIEL